MAEPKNHDTSYTKPVASLASRLNRNFLWRLLTSYIFFDLVILLIVICTGAYQAEKAALGPSWDIRIFRELGYAEDLPAGPMSWSAKLAYLEYRITPRDQHEIAPQDQPEIVPLDQTHDQPEKEAEEPSTIVIEAGTFAQTVYRSGLAVVILQFLHFIQQYFKGKAANYRILEAPLQEMADQAELLSKFDLQQESYHDMENAIESLSPATPNAKIETGDPNLQGLEEAINDLLARTHAAYRQQIRFVSDASHELRTPIAVIQGYADLLARWGSEDQAVLEEGITAIQAEAGQMKTLVEQLLFLARGDAGRNPMNFETLDLAQLVQETAEEYRMIDHDHVWQIMADQPVLAKGDRKMLKQVLRILVDNAKRYSPSGTEIRLKAFHTEGQRPAFLVQDMGTGIAREDLPRIFDRFYRSDPARKREGGGTGLGLSIAKWIVDSHQGHFTVLSREDLGTRITVVLPEYQAKEPEYQAVEPEHQAEESDQ